MGTHSAHIQMAQAFLHLPSFLQPRWHCDLTLVESHVTKLSHSLLASLRSVSWLVCILLDSFGLRLVYAGVSGFSSLSRLPLLTYEGRAHESPLFFHTPPPP